MCFMKYTIHSNSCCLCLLCVHCSVPSRALQDTAEFVIKDVHIRECVIRIRARDYIILRNLLLGCFYTIQYIQNNILPTLFFEVLYDLEFSEKKSFYAFFIMLKTHGYS